MKAFITQDSWMCSRRPNWGPFKNCVLYYVVSPQFRHQPPGSYYFFHKGRTQPDCFLLRDSCSVMEVLFLPLCNPNTNLWRKTFYLSLPFNDSCLHLAFQFAWMLNKQAANLYVAYSVLYKLGIAGFSLWCHCKRQVGHNIHVVRSSK